MPREASAEQAKPPIPGMVRQTEIRIAPETTGRLATIAVIPGQHVQKGDILAVLDNPELTAAVGEAKAAAASAKAERDRIYSGVRAEEVAIATQAVRTAEANLLLAQQQYDRASALAGKNFATEQALDESTASLAKAKADLDLKRSQAAEASAGPTAEERALADAQVALAEATVADLQAQLDKTRLDCSGRRHNRYPRCRTRRDHWPGKAGDDDGRRMARPGSPSRCVKTICMK